MKSFDGFCSDLLEESKRFLEKAEEADRLTPGSDAVRAYQHACLLLGFCALEAYVSNVAEEMSVYPKIPIHVKGILLEKEVRLEKGEFALTETFKMSRLTDRIEVLYRYYQKQGDIVSEPWWGNLKSGVDLRNKITHPKGYVGLTNDGLTRTLRAIIGCLEALFQAIYKRKFPKTALDILSRLDF